jgi:hypothetical protein
MAAPTPGTRTIPTGRRLPEGFSTKIGFAIQPAVQFWERQIKMPALDGGEPIDITTMLNLRWHTMYPRALVKNDPAQVMAAYDPDCIPTIYGMLNVNTTVTILLPNGGSFCFYGWLGKFEPGELKEGEFPEATIAVYVSNYDPINFVEAAPVYTAPAGTP